MHYQCGCIHPHYIHSLPYALPSLIYVVVMKVVPLHYSLFQIAVSYSIVQRSKPFALSLILIRVSWAITVERHRVLISVLDPKWIIGGRRRISEYFASGLRELISINS